jgi:S-adenosylmethionine:tRNA ribosyltransferase-isomerase
MKTEALNYHLPVELIAQQPAEVRGGSRLLVFERSSGELVDSCFGRIGDFLSSGDCLVLNDTKVLPARFFCRRKSGGKLEGLFLAESEKGIWEIMLKGSGRLKAGESIYLRDREKNDFCEAVFLEKTGGGRCKLKIAKEGSSESILEETGFAPLPPYIKRGDNASQDRIDKKRYQTVYAREEGAVAAPTAGLHFTKELIRELKKKGVVFAYVTLHVGMGTFRPITSENIEEHEIHEERFSIDEENAGIINAAKEGGRRIVAVGTTSVRTLEAAVVSGQIEAVRGSTKLFIIPGYKFKIVDSMITNFHLPRSTLLALVAAFAGLENILGAYQHAAEQRYRFYSYGDTMLIS